MLSLLVPIFKGNGDPLNSNMLGNNVAFALGGRY